MVDVSGASEVLPVKRPKKRKSIGQDSLRKKTQGLAKKITELRKPGSISEEVQLVPTEPREAITRCLSNTTRDVQASTSTIPNADVFDQRKKRGRNQKTVVNESIQTEKAAMQPEATDAEIEAPQEISPAFEEFGSQPSEPPTAPKRKSRKRKPIGQAQRPRKRVATKAPGELNLDPSPTDSDIAPFEKTAAPPNFPQRRDKSLSPPPIEDAQDEAPHDIAEQVQVPKKRGRPKKSQNSSSQILPNTVEMAGDKEGIENGQGTRGRLKREAVPAIEPDSAKVFHDPMTQMEEDIGSYNRAPKKIIKVHQSVISDRLPSDQGAITASPGPATPCLYPKKKRGRPKRQISEHPAVKPTVSCPLPGVPEANTVCSESKTLSPPPAKKRGRPKKRVVEPLAAPTAAKNTAIPKEPATKPKTSPIPAKPSTTRNSKIRVRRTALTLQDDDDDDPLSESTTFQPIRKPIPNRSKRPLQARKQPSSKPSKILDPRPQDHGTVDEAQPLMIEPHAQEAHAPKTTASDEEQSPDHNIHLPLTDLDAHIERSLLEEAALKQDLKDLHDQQAQEIAETTKERDRALLQRLETLSSARVKKKKSRVDNEGLTGWNNGSLGVKRKRNPRDLGSLFRTVAARRRGMGGEDIDPDLQGMLDQVKGVGG
ncbi:MAG: hypothetical protein Q9223_001875 [Gallowayella weberi]